MGVNEFPCCARLLRIQFCQHCGGVDLVNKILASLSDSPNLVMVDVHGYDAWPTVACLKHCAQHPGTARLCATLCGSKSGGNFVQDTIEHTLYSLVRADKIPVAGFPNFKALLAEMKSCKDEMMDVKTGYSVTVPLPDGSLPIQEACALLLGFCFKCHVVSEVHVAKWSVDEQFAHEFKKLLNDSWNPEFNKNNARAPGTGAEAAGAVDARVWVKLATPYANLAALTAGEPSLASTPVKTGLTLWGSKTAGLWISNETAGDMTIKAFQELFGFGSGDFLEGQEATDTMKHDGSWLPTKFDLDTWVNIDASTLPEHCASLTQMEYPVQLKTIFRMFADLGEKVGISHHEVDMAAMSIKPGNKKICFLLDKKPPGKKSKKAGKSE